MKLKDYAAIMTGVAAANLTCVIQLCFTDADLIEIALACVMFAALAVAAFEVVTGIIDGDRAEAEALRKARRNRQRRRKDIPVVYMALDWPMYDDKGKRVEELR